MGQCRKCGIEYDFLNGIDCICHTPVSDYEERMNQEANQYEAVGDAIFNKRTGALVVGLGKTFEERVRRVQNDS